MARHEGECKIRNQNQESMNRTIFTKLSSYGHRLGVLENRGAWLSGAGAAIGVIVGGVLQIAVQLLR